MAQAGNVERRAGEDGRVDAMTGVPWGLFDPRPGQQGRDYANAINGSKYW